MDSWRGAEDPSCPACGEPLEATAMDCPSCGEQFLSDEDAQALAEHLAETMDTQRRAPRWAVLLTGLALGIATAPLLTYAVAIATGVGSLPVLGGLLLAGWLLPALYLSRLRNPSEVLSRGLYLVFVGVVVVVLAIGYDATLGPATVSEGTAVLLALLAVPACLAILLARRASNRAARQLRGEPGQLHELAGIEDADSPLDFETAGLDGEDSPLASSAIGDEPAGDEADDGGEDGRDRDEDQ